MNAEVADGDLNVMGLAWRHCDGGIVEVSLTTDAGATAESVPLTTDQSLVHQLGQAKETLVVLGNHCKQVDTLAGARPLLVHVKEHATLLHRPGILARFLTWLGRQVTHLSIYAEDSCQSIAVWIACKESTLLRTALEEGPSRAAASLAGGGSVPTTPRLSLLLVDLPVNGTIDIATCAASTGTGSDKDAEKRRADWQRAARAAASSVTRTSVACRLVLFVRRPSVAGCTTLTRWVGDRCPNATIELNVAPANERDDDNGWIVRQVVRVLAGKAAVDNVATALAPTDLSHDAMTVPLPEPFAAFQDVMSTSLDLPLTPSSSPDDCVAPHGGRQFLLTHEALRGTGNQPFVWFRGDAGQGDATRSQHVIVAVHGLTDSPHYITALCRRLFHRFPTCTVVGALLPGHGLRQADPALMRDESIRVQWHETVRRLVTDVAPRFGRTVSLVGFSLGFSLCLRHYLTDRASVSGGIFAFSGAMDLGKRETMAKVPGALRLADRQQEDVIAADDDAHHYKGSAKVLGLVVARVAAENRQLVLDEGPVGVPLFVGHAVADDIALVGGAVHAIVDEAWGGCGASARGVLITHGVTHSSLVLDQDSGGRCANPVFDQLAGAFVDFFADRVDVGDDGTSDGGNR